VESRTSNQINPLIGRRVLVAGLSQCKGYVGYVRSVGPGIAHVWFDANHSIQALPRSNIIDLYEYWCFVISMYANFHGIYSSSGTTLQGDDIPPQWRQVFCKALRNYVRGHNPRSITPPPKDFIRLRTPSPSFTPASSRSPSPRPIPASNTTAAAFSVTTSDIEDLRAPYSKCALYQQPVLLMSFRGTW
jgi:hypothetical protein